ncbi:MAG: Ribonucleotide monophosphatase NagD [Holosporales bacterium]
MKTFIKVIDLYDFFIFDVWGVLHNGETLFPWTLNTLQVLKQKGKCIALLSNSPRLVLDSKKHLMNKGLTPDLFDFLITSGQRTHDFLKTANFKNAFFIGPDHEKNILNGLNIDCVLDVNHADFLLVTGLDGKNIAFYEELLLCAQKKDLPMICSNPDKGAMLLEDFILSAGSLAEHYEQKGGNVLYFGKPYKDIYNYLFEAVSKNMVPCHSNKILAVGDSLLTDIKGAIEFGIDSALVLSGITTVQNLADINGITPTYIFENISF